MKFKPVLLLILLVVMPVVQLTWLGMRMATSERDLLQQRTRELLADRLGDVDQTVAGHLSVLARDLDELTSLDSYSTDLLREKNRSDPRVLQLFVIRPDGALLYPDPTGPLNRTEQEFLARASQIVVDRELQRAAAGSGEGRSPATSSPADSSRPGPTPAVSDGEPRPRAGWFTWYWGRGLNLVYWQRRPTGHLVGVALERSRWIADLIGALPDTPLVSVDTPIDTSSQIRLIDSTSQTVYQWGPFTPAATAEPTCEIALSEPLSAWRLQQFIPADRQIAGTRFGTLWSLTSGLAAAAIGLVTIATFLFREYVRDMRDAGQRVSFVNQVSHELRTPLTNIRLYADLLEADLATLAPEDAEQPRSRLKVIHSESQRLHRIVGNVLSFAQNQRETLAVHPQPGCIDTIVTGVLERSGPSLTQQGIVVNFDGHAAREVLVDAVALEQMLDNLLSNVEKYAAEGGWVGITTRQDGDVTEIAVADHGPGIVQSSRAHVFEPFWRGSDCLTHAAGTGIGLSIARELARLHGGDVRLDASQRGAVFRIELQTPPVEGTERS